MKKILKNILGIVLIISMLFLLAGCGNKDEEDTAKKNEETNIKQEEQIVEFSMGEWNDNVYENNFLGIKFNLPEGWKSSTDEEIAEMMNLGVEMLNDDQKAAAELAELTSVTYVVANNPNTGNSVTIMSEKPLMEVTTEYYITQLRTQLSAIESMKYEIGETSKEKIADTEYDVLTVSVPDYGIMQKYYVHKMDKYIICIIATSVNGETGINEIIECFE